MEPLNFKEFNANSHLGQVVSLRILSSVERELAELLAEGHEATFPATTSHHSGTTHSVPWSILCAGPFEPQYPEDWSSFQGRGSNFAVSSLFSDTGSFGELRFL